VSEKLCIGFEFNGVESSGSAVGVAIEGCKVGCCLDRDALDSVKNGEFSRVLWERLGVVRG
jgi:hypothetical protein